MNEYSEKRTIARAVPVDRSPIVEKQYDTVVTERQPTSGVAIAAMVIAAVAAAVVVTILVLNSQQSDRDQQLALERERTAAAQQQAIQRDQQSQQPPVILTVPQQSPTASSPTAPSQTPAQSQVAPSEASAPSSIDIEIAVTSKLLDDQDLHTYAVDAKAKSGIVTLSGTLPSEDLKARAERVTKTVKGVRDVINNIIVQP